jgi:hypothetical protein
VIDSQGEHTIEAKAVDNVGNESETKKVSFSVDVNPPTTEIRKVDAGSSSNTQPAAQPAPAPAPTTSTPPRR